MKFGQQLQERTSLLAGNLKNFVEQCFRFIVAA